MMCMIYCRFYKHLYVDSTHYKKAETCRSMIKRAVTDKYVTNTVTMTKLFNYNYPQLRKIFILRNSVYLNYSTKNGDCQSPLRNS